MKIELDLYMTMALAVAVYYFGMLLKRKIALLNIFCIPAPVVGGLAFVIVTTALRLSGVAIINLNTSLQDVFMNAFFTSIGYSASMKVIKKGGMQVVKFVVLVTVLVVLQCLVGVLLAIPFGIDPLLGLCTGSIPMVGGHGNAASFGPLLEGMGVAGAEALAVASATFGLVAGGIIGGPVAKRLIEKKHIEHPHMNGQGIFEGVESRPKEHNKPVLSEAMLMRATALLFLAMGIGTPLSAFMNGFGITLPSFIGALVAAAILRNIFDAAGFKEPYDEIDAVGEVCLGMFLSLALISLKLWEIFDLALPMVVMLMAQVLLMALFAYFVSYRFMGRDYNACCITAGFCGFGMGATPNAMANLDAVTNRYGPCTNAYIVVAIVGGLFSNLSNSVVVTAFINILR